MEKQIHKGIYIVVNPSKEASHICRQLERLKNEKIAAVQIWDNPDCENIDQQLIERTIQLFEHSPIPVIINNRQDLLQQFDFDGIHFDILPDNFQFNRRKVIIGLTMGNKLDDVQKAEQIGFDYLSFCSLFPSKTSNSCEIVTQESILMCSRMTKMPIFVAGGINLKQCTYSKSITNPRNCSCFIHYGNTKSQFTCATILFHFI